MGAYTPSSGAHAVQEATIGIRLVGNVADATWQKAVERAAALAHSHNLPGRVNLDPMALTFSRQVVSLGYAQSFDASPGILFQRTDTSGITEEELTIDRGSIAYRTRRYQRWADVLNLITSVIVPVSSLLAENRASSISVIELRCVDVFEAESLEPPELFKLVRQGTKLVSPQLLNTSSLLHSHSGWFDEVSESSRLLINLNLDLSGMPPQKRVAQITQLVSKQYAPTFVQKVDAPIESVIKDDFARLHQIDKSILGAILTDEMQTEIGLQGSSGVQPL